jgi:hypothetical protein
LELSLEPRPLMTLTIASEMPVAIRPSSMAVAPVSSRQNFRINRFESSPSLSKYLLDSKYPDSKYLLDRNAAFLRDTLSLAEPY